MKSLIKRNGVHKLGRGDKHSRDIGNSHSHSHGQSRSNVLSRNNILALLTLASALALSTLSTQARTDEVKKAKFEKTLADSKVRVTVDEDSGLPWLGAYVDSEEEPQCRYAPEEPLLSFTNADQYKLKNYERPVIISKWEVGVHGQRVVIIDPKLGKDCVLDVISSADGVDFEVKDGELFITVYDDKRLPDEAGKSAVQTLWSSPKKNTEK